MPINEATGLRRSNLTKEQRREAERAIYGLPTTNHDMELTAQEIERMREIVQQHDRTQKPAEFDLNNPKTPPYRHQQFPQMIYNHSKREHRIVRSLDELQGFLELGWSEEPYPQDAPAPVQLDAAAAAEAARVDEQLAELRRKKK